MTIIFDVFFTKKSLSYTLLNVLLYNSYSSKEKKNRKSIGLTIVILVGLPVSLVQRE